MKLDDAIDILTKHNEWRRDENVPNSKYMVDPNLLGVAIDTICKLKGAIVIPDGWAVCVDKDGSCYLANGDDIVKPRIFIAGSHNDMIKDCLEQIKQIRL